MGKLKIQFIRLRKGQKDKYNPIQYNDNKVNFYFWKCIIIIKYRSSRNSESSLYVISNTN